MDQRLVDIKTAARLLCTTPGSLYVKVSKGLVPYVKFGRRTLFDVRKLDQLIESKSVEPKSFNFRQKYNKILE